MLRAAGWTFDQIAEALGISRPTLRLHYRRFVAEKTPTAKSAVGGRKPGSGRPRGSRSRERSLMVREMDELLKVLDRVAPLNEGRRRR
jgi:predicted ArsR family transcriptional regulator